MDDLRQKVKQEGQEQRKEEEMKKTKRVGGGENGENRVT